jgi:hypothetical protein
MMPEETRSRRRRGGGQEGRQTGQTEKRGKTK